MHIEKQSLKRIFGLALIATIVGVLWSLREQYSPTCLIDLVQRFEGWELPIYLAMYMIAPLFMLPGVPIAILGGVLFGPLWGTLYAVSGATLGATLALLAARTLARDWVEAKLPLKWRKASQEIDTHGWKAVALARLLPIVPYNVLNYALGLTRINVWLHAAVTAVFIIPVNATYAYVGHAGQKAIVSGGEIDLKPALQSLTLLTCIILLPLGVRYIQNRRLARMTAHAQTQG